MHDKPLLPLTARILIASLAVLVGFHARGAALRLAALPPSPLQPQRCFMDSGLFRLLGP